MQSYRNFAMLSRVRIEKSWKLECSMLKLLKMVKNLMIGYVLRFWLYERDMTTSARVAVEKGSQLDGHRRICFTRTFSKQSRLHLIAKDSCFSNIFLWDLHFKHASTKLF